MNRAIRRTSYELRVASCASGSKGKALRYHPAPMTASEPQSLRLGDRSFDSRLILGTGKYTDSETMLAAFEASGTEMITVALRRVDLDQLGKDSLIDQIDQDKYLLLPNTAGCYDADSAIRTARLAREVGGWNWVKLEVIGDPDTLFPDNIALLEATKVLVDEGFIVLPYTNDDPVMCKKLQDLGAAAVMPLGAPIGSGMGSATAPTCGSSSSRPRCR